jgi:hypothetical protein
MQYKILLHSTALQHCAAITEQLIKDDNVSIRTRIQINFESILYYPNTAEFKHIVEAILLVYFCYYIYRYKHYLQHRLFKNDEKFHSIFIHCIRYTPVTQNWKYRYKLKRNLVS